MDLGRIQRHPFPSEGENSLVVGLIEGGRICFTRRSSPSMLPRYATWRWSEPRGGKIARPRLIKTGFPVHPGGWSGAVEEAKGNGGEGGGANGESGETRNITELYMRVFNSVINSKNR